MKKDKILLITLVTLSLGVVMLFGSSYALIINELDDVTFNIQNITSEYKNSVNMYPKDNLYVVKVKNNTSDDINYRLDIISNEVDKIIYSYTLNNNLMNNDLPNNTINQNKLLKKGEIDTYQIRVLEGNISYLTFNIYASLNQDKYATTLIERIFDNLEIVRVGDDYRYQTENPNNYVLFNDELWRIIGSFKKESGYNLKIMKDEIINQIAFNNEELRGDFNDSFINTYLNGYYYDTLKDNARKLIDKSTWYIGSTTKRSFNEVLNDEKLKRYDAYVGLINLSDYLYLQNNNWMKYSDKIMLLNKHEDFVNVIDNGVSTSESYEEIAYIPCVYLRSDVSIIKGNGTKNNPYNLDIIYYMND